MVEREGDRKLTSSNLIRWGALAAILAGGTFTVETSIGLFNPVEVRDHTTSAGFLSEALLAVALLFVMGGLVGLHARQAGNYGRLGKAGFLVAFIGLALVLPQLTFVLLTGNEPPEWLLTPGALAILIGVVLFGAATLRARVLPRWGGLALMVFFPVVFLGGYVGAFLVGLIWLALGYALWSSSDVSGRQPARP